jgi:hypothetical protein
MLHLTASALALPALPRAAFALDYPTRPVRGRRNAAAINDQGDST